MEFVDSEDDFCLTQTPSMSYVESNSAGYGGDVVDGKVVSNQDLVSLENVNDLPNFDLACDLSQFSQKKYAYDNVEIEDISSDEELEAL